MTCHPVGNRWKIGSRGVPLTHTPPNMTLYASLIFPFKRVMLGENIFNRVKLNYSSSSTGVLWVQYREGKLYWPALRGELSCLLTEEGLKHRISGPPASNQIWTFITVKILAV